MNLDFDGIQMIQVPLPGYSSLGTANIFLLTSSPVTLIDTGPKYPGSFEYVKDEINRSGLSTVDIERILITHSHVDHFGLVESIRKDAGKSIPCFIHPKDLWRLGPDSHRQEILNGEVELLAAMVGMPTPELEKIKEQFPLFDVLCDPVGDALTMEDNDIFEGDGYEIRVVHTPGHTPGSCCFYETRRKILFSGDHILKHITPNPLYPLRKDLLQDHDYKSLKIYLQSLDKVAALDVKQVLTGHKDPVDDIQALVLSYRKHHREREDRIWQALHKKARPLYDIFSEVFDFIPENDVLLAVSEILVHLEMLVEAGRVTLVDSGPPAMYRTEKKKE